MFGLFKSCKARWVRDTLATDNKSNLGTMMSSSSSSTEKAVATTNINNNPPTQPSNNTTCPYLDTINRTVLDFDSPDHACSITLESSPHIYACLICGKFFRGRGKQTPAYTHSVDEGHFVYVHLTHGTFWCIPDNYEIKLSDEPSLKDIQLALQPKFTVDEVKILDDNTELSRDLFGRRYLPGYIGLNNLKRTDYLNAVVQALGHVRPLRDFFLLAANDNNNTHGSGVPMTMNGNGKRRFSTEKAAVSSRTISYDDFSPLAKSFSLLLRNMWSSHRFKSNVDPHMFVQAVSVASNKRYHVGKQAEAGEFLAWLLHQLHVGVGGSVIGRKKSKKKKKEKKDTTATKVGSKEDDHASSSSGSSIIHDTFMGRVEMTTVVRRRKLRGEGAALQMLNQGGGMMETTGTTSMADDAHAAANDDDDDDDDGDGSDDEETIERKRKKRETVQSLANETIIVEEETVTETDFLQLTLDIPEKPLFKDEDGGLVIPQEPLVNVLRKFDGVSFSDVLAMQEIGGSDDNGTVVSKKRCYRLKKLPNYLILHLSRFKRNGFFIEKNPTIVMFPVKNFDLSSYVFPEGGRDKVPTVQDVKGMSVRCQFLDMLL